MSTMENAAPTQTQAFLIPEHQVELRETPVPEPGPHQVLVEVAAVGICGSDVHYFDHGRIADFVVREPLVLGHEASGTIRAVGSAVTDRAVGQRVAMEPQETCGRCRECQSGRYNLCPDVRFFATPPIHGAFAQYVILEAHRAHPVPDSLSDEAAALIEPLSVGVWAAQKAQIQPGDRVLVIGAGPVGLLCADVARARARPGSGSATPTTTGWRWPRPAARPDDQRPGRPAGLARSSRSMWSWSAAAPRRPCSRRSRWRARPPGSCWSVSATRRSSYRWR